MRCIKYLFEVSRYSNSGDNEICLENYVFFSKRFNLLHPFGKNNIDKYQESKKFYPNFY